MGIGRGTETKADVTKSSGRPICIDIASLRAMVENLFYLGLFTLGDGTPPCIAGVKVQSPRPRGTAHVPYLAAKNLAAGSGIYTYNY